MYTHGCDKNNIHISESIGTIYRYINGIIGFLSQTINNILYPILLTIVSSTLSHILFSGISYLPYIYGYSYKNNNACHTKSDFK